MAGAEAMKAISLWEPYASLIRCRAKTIETRSWATNYRGPLLICAAKGGLPMYELIGILCQQAFHDGLSSLAQPGRGIKITDLNHGKMVARVNLVDCKKTDDLKQSEIGGNFPFGNFPLGRYAWIFTDVIPVKMAKVKGSQGFFNVDDNLIHQDDGGRDHEQ
jgi:hypothetical protein